MAFRLAGWFASGWFGVLNIEIQTCREMNCSKSNKRWSNNCLKISTREVLKRHGSLSSCRRVLEDLGPQLIDTNQPHRHFVITCLCVRPTHTHTHTRTHLQLQVSSSLGSESEGNKEEQVKQLHQQVGTQGSMPALSNECTVFVP